MRKLLLILLCFVLLAFTPSTTAFMLVGDSTPEAGGASASDIVFWLNFEEGDNVTPYTMGAGECSDGDTAGDFAGSMAVNVDAALTGTYGLDSPGAGDYITFNAYNDDIVNATACIIGFKLYINTWANLSTLVEYYVDGSNYFSLRLSNDGDDFYIYWYEGGVSKVIGDIDVNLSATTEYYVEFFIDAANNVRKVRIDGGGWVSDATEFVGFAGAVDTNEPFRTGSVTNANDVYIDQVIVSFDITTPRDLNALKDTATKLDGSCDG